MAATAALGAACTSASTSASTSTSTTVTPQASTVSTTAPPSIPTGSTKLTVDRYLTIDGLDMPIDAYVPTGPGPWLVVVTFHGRSSAFKDAESNTLIAEQATAEGMLVFAPTWIAGDPFPLDAEDIVDLRHAASCAVSFAQQWAIELGGDPTATVTHGFSAGAGPALSALVAPSADVPECAVATAPLSVAGAVLGDGEYFFQSQPFDTAFADDLAAMQAEVAGLSNPDQWPSGLDASVFVWAAEDGTAPKAIDDPNAPNWLDDRDPDGSIAIDLERLGRLADGVVDYVDAAGFIDLRLGEAGLDSEFEVFRGGHTVADKIEPLVAALRAVGAGE